MIINENFKIESEGRLNVVLYEKKTVKEGKLAGDDRWIPIAYCPNVKSALKTLVDKEILGTGLHDFETVVKKVEELKEAIDNLDV